MTEMIVRKKPPKPLVHAQMNGQRLTFGQTPDGLITVHRGETTDERTLYIMNGSGRMSEKDLQEVMDYQLSKAKKVFVPQEELQELQDNFREQMRDLYHYLKGHPSVRREQEEMKEKRALAAGSPWYRPPRPTQFVRP